MIVERNQYLSANNTMTRASNLFHEDLVIVEGQYKKIKAFEDPSSAVMVQTKYKDLYFSPKDKVVTKDLLLPNIQNNFVNCIYQMDEIVLPYVDYSYGDNFLDIRKHLLFGSYLYSTSFYDLMLKYDLPKDFLYKALQNGCPDQEYPKGQEYNKKLHVIMCNLGCNSIQELRQDIIKEYSFKVSRTDQKILVKDGLLDLIYLFLTESYSLITHTTIKLYIEDSSVFQNVIAFLLKYKINKVVSNSIYNAKDCSVITVNSSLLYSLFSDEFNNLDFLLSLSKFHSSLVLKKLKDKSFVVKKAKTASFLQEFFYRNKLLYSISKVDNKIHIDPVLRYKKLDIGFLIPVEDVIYNYKSSTLLDIITYD